MFSSLVVKALPKVNPKTRRILFSSPVLFGMKRPREGETIIAVGRKCEREKAVMSNTVNMIRVEKYFLQFVRADKLPRLDIQNCRVENSSHQFTKAEIRSVQPSEKEVKEIENSSGFYNLLTCHLRHLYSLASSLLFLKQCTVVSL